MFNNAKAPDALCPPEPPLRLHKRRNKRFHEHSSFQRLFISSRLALVVKCFFKRFCCRPLLIALRETCIFTTARAATSVAANAARVPHGPAAVVRRRRSLTNSDSRAKASCAHGRRTYAFAKLRFTRLRALRTMSVNAASRRNGHGPDDLIKALHWERRRHDARLMGYSRFHQNGIPLAFQEATVRSS